MSFTAISRWKLDEDFDDEALTAAANTYISELRQHGAERAAMVRTGATEGLMISVYADETTFEAARENVMAMQKQRMSELPVELLEELNGPILTDG